MEGVSRKGKSVKVLFCTDGIFPYSVGGMQRHSRLLIEELSRRPDITICVVHPHAENVFGSQYIEEIQVRPIDIKKNYLVECYKYSKQVYDIILNRPEYIVYAQGLSVWYNIKNIRNKIIVNPHGLEPYQAIGLKSVLMALPFKLVFQHIFRHSYRVISLGGKLTKILRSNIRPVEKIVEIPNAVNINVGRRSMPRPNKPMKVLFVGRFAHNKGIDILFKAIEALHSKGLSSNFDFTLVGKGPLLNFYKEHNRYKHVNITGPLSDTQIQQLYLTSDVFVLPTLFEGMPTVVLEAMSFGLPIIVSDVGATAVLTDDENGVLIHPGSTQRLVDALIKLEKLGPEQREAMGKRSFEKVCSRFTWDRIADAHMHLFESLSND